MSTVIAKNVQVGTSGTATNNFTLYQPASPDGTVRLANGNSGTTTDLVTVTSAGNVGVGTSSPIAKLEVAGAAVIGTNVYESGAIEVGRFGSGDRAALIDFVSSGASGAVDFSARLIRSSGVNGSFELINTGTGDIALAPGTGASWYIRQNSGTSYGGALRIGSPGAPEGALDFSAEADVRWLARGGRLDCVNGANNAWQTGVFRGNNLYFRTANDATRFSINSDGRCYFDNSSASRGATGYPLTTPNDSVANCIRAAGYLEWQTDIGAIGTTYFTSDIRKKENIAPCIFNSSDLISKIEFIGFDWKPESGNTGRVDVGISAQQLQALDARLVSELSDGGLMVNEPSLVAHMAKAIQEQQAIIEQLKADVAALKAGQAPTDTP